MKRLVLIAIISLCSMVAFAGTHSERNANKQSEYSITKVLVLNNEINDFAFDKVTYKNNLFEFTSEGSDHMSIEYDARDGEATVLNSDGLSKVRAKMETEKSGEIVLTYGGYTVYLDPIK